jgi:hypothetical protein
VHIVWRSPLGASLAAGAGGTSKPSRRANVSLIMNSGLPVSIRRRAARHVPSLACISASTSMRS